MANRWRSGSRFCGRASRSAPSLYSAVLFFGEQMEEREPILRARIKVSPQMLKAFALLASKHVREYEDAVGPITLPDQVYNAWELEPEQA